MPYRFIISDYAARQIDDLAEDTQLRILNRLSALPDRPYGGRAKKLRGYQFVWVIRAGNYRVAYSVFEEADEIHIEAVGHRRDFYPRLERLPHLR